MTDFKIVDEVIKILKADDDEKLKEKIECGIDVDIPLPPELPDEDEVMRNGVPLVSACAYYGSFKCLKYLISKGCSKTNFDDEGNSTAFYAAYSGNMKMIELLKELDFNLFGCGQAAIKSRNIELFQAIMEKNFIKFDDKDGYNSTYLHVASFEGYLDVVKFLNEKTEIDLNSVDLDVNFIFLVFVYYL